MRSADAGAFSEVLRQTFRVDEAPAFVARTLSKAQIAVVEINCEVADNGLSEPMPPEDAILVVTQLRDCPAHEMFFDGRSIETGYLPTGSTSIYDLREKPRANSISPFHHLSFYIPRHALNRIVEMEGTGAVEAFDNDPGHGAIDPVLHGLAKCLLPGFGRPEAFSTLHIDHLTVAAAVHIVQKYGQGASIKGLRRATLAPWQERRAKELLRERLDGDVTLGELASACGLPVRAFARGFRNLLGMPPHRWLEQQRRQTARALLARTPPLALEEVAARSGFRTIRRLVRALGDDAHASASISKT